MTEPSAEAREAVAKIVYEAEEAARAKEEGESAVRRERRVSLAVADAVLAYLADALAESRARVLRETARRICERCLTTPHLPAFPCVEHCPAPGYRALWCHESGITGWGHYPCSATAVHVFAAEASESTAKHAWEEER